jgi:phage gp36-like protein
MTAYLAIADFKLTTDMPSAFVDEIEVSEPGWVDKALDMGSAYIDSRLAKRYAAPFEAPYPIAVIRWLTDLVTLRCWRKRGVVATDEQMIDYRAAADAAMRELTEAANSDTGLFDLPQRADVDTSGITRGFPRSYSEQSPYVWYDVQAEVGRDEDVAGEGTFL